MGHFLFSALHLSAFFVGYWTLVLTVPLHLIYSTLAARNRRDGIVAAEQSLMVRCDACRELVRPDAVKCRHCGATLVPKYATMPEVERPSTAPVAAIVATAVVVGVLVLFRSCG